MNVFFMGTPEFAVPTLDILNKNYNVIGVFTCLLYTSDAADD